MKLKFKKGDQVVITDGEAISSILADNLLELQDGEGVNQDKLHHALYNRQPFTVDHWEGEHGDGGYVLRLKGKLIYGLHPEETLQPL